MTRNSTRMEINTMDYAALPVFIIAAAMSLGLLSATWVGFDFGATLLDLGSGHGFSAANLIAIATLGYVAYTNDWNGDVAWMSIQGWLVIATVGLLIAPPFLPIVSDTIAAGPAAFVALAIQVGGFATFSYVG